MTRELLSMALESLEGYRRELNDLQPCDAEKAIIAELAKPARQPTTLGQKQKMWSSAGEKPTLKDRVNAFGMAIEAFHGIEKH